MSNYWIIDSIQKARNLEALAEVEKWINKLMPSKTTKELADMLLIKKWNLLTTWYSEKG